MEGVLIKVTGGNRNTDVNTFQSRESMAQLPVDPEQVKRDAVLMANVSGLSDSSADPTYVGEKNTALVLSVITITALSCKA